MTNAELQTIIADSPNAEWFNKVETTFSFPYIGFSLKLIGFPSIFSFVNQQIEGWNKSNSLPNELKISLDFFNDRYRRLERTI